MDDLKSLEFAIVENVQRHDLNPLEEAQGYKRLIDEFFYDQDKVSKFIGKSRSYITNSLRLLNLPSDVLILVEQRKISAGHAKVLVGLDNASFVASKIIEKQLSVRQSENFVKIFKKQKIKNFVKDPNLRDLEQSIQDKIGLRVNIKSNLFILVSTFVSPINEERPLPKPFLIFEFTKLHFQFCFLDS